MKNKQFQKELREKLINDLNLKSFIKDTDNEKDEKIRNFINERLDGLTKKRKQKFFETTDRSRKIDIEKEEDENFVDYNRTFFIPRPYQDYVIKGLINSFDKKLEYGILNVLSDNIKRHNKLLQVDKNGNEIIYQTEHFQDYIKGRSLLEIGMSLGKTAIILMALENLMYQKNKIKKILVIAPAVVAYTTWGDEIDKWEQLKHMSYDIVIKDKPKLRELQYAFPKTDLLCISDSLLPSFLGTFLNNPFLDFPYDAIVVDESSRFKDTGDPMDEKFLLNYFLKNNLNPKEKKRGVKYQSLKLIINKFNPKFVSLLTGTLAPRDSRDIFPQTFLLDRGASFTLNKDLIQQTFLLSTGFDVIYDSRQKKKVKIPKDYILNSIGEIEVPKILNQYTYSMHPEDVLKELVPNNKENIYIDLDTTVLRDYNTLKKELFLAVEKDGNYINVGSKVVGANTKRLNQFTNGTVYVDIEDLISSTSDLTKEKNEVESLEGDLIDRKDQSFFDEWSEETKFFWKTEEKYIEKEKWLTINNLRVDDKSKKTSDLFEEYLLSINFDKLLEDKWLEKTNKKNNASKKEETLEDIKNSPLTKKFDSILEKYKKNIEGKKQNENETKTKKKGKVREYAVIHLSKIKALEKILDDHPNESIFVLYEFKSDYDLIKKHFEAKDVDVTLLKSPESIRKWNKKKCRIGIAHPGSVAYGLNMQDGGHIVVWYGWEDSPELIAQTDCRLPRPGQKSPFVLTYRIVANGTKNKKRILNTENKIRNMKVIQQLLRINPEEYNTT